MGLQAKLQVNRPKDSYEHEADRVADQVMSRPAGHGGPARTQRLAGPDSGGLGAAPASVGQALAAPGRPLEPVIQHDMEQRFGHDFSRVRVHTDSSAAESVRAVSARAYTVGGDIAFDRGQYAPETSAGKRLLAHELTHVLQQGGDEISPVGPGTRESTSGGQQAALQRDATDDLADEIAHDLDKYVAQNASPYDHILEVFHKLDSDIEDNVAAAFTE